MASTLKKTFSSFRGPSILRRGRERGGGGGGGGGGEGVKMKMTDLLHL